MVRAVILGLLMPASNDPRRDRDVFLALLTMDEEGLWRRKRRAIPLKEVWQLLSPEERTDVVRARHGFPPPETAEGPDGGPRAAAAPSSSTASPTTRS